MISIIVPICNSENTLRECLDSILSQTYQDYELILINDGSTDNSDAICQEFANKHIDLIRYYQKENGGVSSARNLGIDKAKGEYICFIDSDDYVEKTYLKVLHDAIINYDTVFSMCDIYIKEKVVTDENIILSDNNDIVSAIMSKQFGLKNRGPYCKLFSREVVGDLRFNESIFLGEDTLFCIEYAKRCRKGIYVRKGLYHYDSSTSSITYRTDPRLLKKYLTYIDSRREMLYDTSMLNRHSFTLLANSLFESVQESYFVAKRARKKDVQNSLCSLLKDMLIAYNLSFTEQDKPISWFIMANWPRWFDEWMYIYGKYHGLLHRLGV